MTVIELWIVVGAPQTDARARRPLKLAGAS
jgi:hypothetical protein